MAERALPPDCTVAVAVTHHRLRRKEPADRSCRPLGQGAEASFSADERPPELSCHPVVVPRVRELGLELRYGAEDISRLE